MSGLDLKEQLTFSITFARLWYGNGPYRSFHRLSADDEPDPNEDQPYMYLDAKPKHRELRRHLGKRPVNVHIYRHPTGQKTNNEKTVLRGCMSIGELEENGASQGYVQIDGLLPPQTYDSVASMLMTNGIDLLPRCTLQIGLQENRDKIDFAKREGLLESADFLIEDLAIFFEIGEQHDDISDE